jgi:hypothetical protein
MPIRGRASIDARLVELEARRDVVGQKMVDRFWQRCDELLGRDRVTELLEGLRDDAPWPAEIAAVIDTDPECMQLSIVARRLATWRRAVEELTGKGRSDNAD